MSETERDYRLLGRITQPAAEKLGDLTHHVTEKYIEPVIGEKATETIFKPQEFALAYAQQEKYPELFFIPVGGVGVRLGSKALPVAAKGGQAAYSGVKAALLSSKMSKAKKAKLLAQGSKGKGVPVGVVGSAKVAATAASKASKRALNKGTLETTVAARKLKAIGEFRGRVAVAIERSVPTPSRLLYGKGLSKTAFVARTAENIAIGSQLHKLDVPQIHIAGNSVSLFDAITLRPTQTSYSAWQQTGDTTRPIPQEREPVVPVQPPSKESELLPRPMFGDKHHITSHRQSDIFEADEGVKKISPAQRLRNSKMDNYYGKKKKKSKDV